jgi:hypothetical protein
MRSDWQLSPRYQEECGSAFQSFPHGSGPTIKQGLRHLIEADSTVFFNVESVKIHNQDMGFVGVGISFQHEEKALMRNSASLRWSTSFRFSAFCFLSAATSRLVFLMSLRRQFSINSVSGWRVFFLFMG